MPGIAGDGSEDLPNIGGTSHNSPTPTKTYPAGDYLSQKLANAYGELKVLTDNIQLMNAQHMKRLVEINSMVGNIMSCLQGELEEKDGK